MKHRLTSLSLNPVSSSGESLILGKPHIEWRIPLSMIDAPRSRNHGWPSPVLVLTLTVGHPLFLAGRPPPGGSVASCTWHSRSRSATSCSWRSRYYISEASSTEVLLIPYTAKQPFPRWEICAFQEGILKQPGLYDLGGSEVQRVRGKKSKSEGQVDE